jgi:hypothetical protein
MLTGVVAIKDEFWLDKLFYQRLHCSAAQKFLVKEKLIDAISAVL